MGSFTSVPVHRPFGFSAASKRRAGLLWEANEFSKQFLDDYCPAANIRGEYGIVTRLIMSTEAESGTIFPLE